MVIIALSGCDGSGKTTIARRLLALFRAMGFKTIYKHEYDYIILKYIFKIIGTKRIENERRKMIVERRRSIKYYLWPLLVWFDALIQYIYLRVFMRKSIVILDRYIYDHYLSFKYLGYLIKSLEVLYRYFPRADVNIILWVNPHIAYERKRSTHSYALNFYIRQTYEYLRFAKEKGIPTVNTEQSVTKTMAEILKIALQCNKFKRIFFERLRINRSLCLALNFLTKILKVGNGLNELYDECILREEMLKNTLRSIKMLEEKLGYEFITIKSFRPYYRVEYNDIDVFVKGITLNELLKRVASIKEIKVKVESENKAELFIQGSYPIELHWNLEWFDKSNLINFKNIDYDFISWFGYKIKVPKPTYELLIIMLHLAFGNATYVSLDDCLYIRYLMSNMRSFHELLKMLKTLSSSDNIYRNLLLLLKDLIRACSLEAPKPWFPPLRILLSLFIEELKYLKSIRSIYSYTKIFFVFNIARRFYYMLKIR